MQMFKGFQFGKGKIVGVAQNNNTEAPQPETRTVHSSPSGKRRIAVVGVGSVGLLSLTFYNAWLPNDWEIVSIHNPKKAILGIGESTNGAFLSLLSQGTGFHMGDPSDMAALDATVKYGSKFSGWREHDWLNPLLDGAFSIHFDNFRLKEFCFERLQERYPQKFRCIEGDVKSMVDEGPRVVLDVDGELHAFDFVMDCSGFPPSMEGYTLSDCTPVNRCLIHSISNYEFEPATDHIAHEHGWMFGVPLQSRKTYGYLYREELTPKPVAEADMKRLLGVDALEGKEYVFNCYYHPQPIQGRICRNGNKALFFEPLVANSIFLYIHLIQLFHDVMFHFKTQDEANSSAVGVIQSLEDTIAYYYAGGSTHDSEFWRQAAPRAQRYLSTREGFWQAMLEMRKARNNGVIHYAPSYGYAAQSWELVDAMMGYGLINPRTAYRHPTSPLPAAPLVTSA